jgi:hypothetical protein
MRYNPGRINTSCMKVGSCNIAGDIVSFWLVRGTICRNLRATVIGKVL